MRGSLYSYSYRFISTSTYTRSPYHLELPTTNLNFWQNILSIIGSQIQSLNITNTDLSIPWDLFANLKFIIISSSFPMSCEKLCLISESAQFNQLQSFKLRSKIFPKEPVSENIIDKVSVKTLFDKIFQWS
jgi:hypothetical protein